MYEEKSRGSGPWESQDSDRGLRVGDPNVGSRGSPWKNGSARELRARHGARPVLRGRLLVSGATPGSSVRKRRPWGIGVSRLKQDAPEMRPDVSLVTLTLRGIFEAPYWAPFGTRRSQAENDTRVHISLRIPLGPFPHTSTREVSDEYVPPMKPTTEAFERAACLQRNRLNRQTSMPIGFESTPLQRTADARATSTIGDDDCTRRPPQVTLTMKIRAFTFIIQTETTSNIIRPR
ncbi:hypothetical protein CRG98_023368 [Punica granatum]|uniref:Uncharacterized protein n=1 Tax=Punica granatum TaxID=22663 RepID=A0A2I0JIZ6_PUNGR|nr:hypothetical protein CRG98_023368 [Punica granatum]